MTLWCSMVFTCANYSTSFSSDDFSSFKNSAKEVRLLRNDVLSLKYDITINHPDLQTFAQSKSCESQAQSSSHRFIGKSEQNITFNHS